MTKKNLKAYRSNLEKLVDRVSDTAASLEEQVRSPSGGQGAGMESNAPMHLADIGSEMYTQELNSTLLENEAYIRDEARLALERIEQGSYGVCENCQTEIPAERLEALPYTRFCVRCAQQLGAGQSVNFNDGRPSNWSTAENSFGNHTASQAEALVADRTVRGSRSIEEDEMADTHAAGTPGGGTAIGGLAGTTIDDGDPENAGLENAMGSGNFDVRIEEDDEDEPVAYAGPKGGAVGGTPAGKRASGGKRPPAPPKKRKS